MPLAMCWVAETYPESEYGLAAFLFQQIVQSERGTEERNRAYYQQLMSECLEIVRDKPQKASRL